MRRDITNERGEVLTIAAMVFGIFTIIMAIGILIDQAVNAPCDTKTQQCIDYGSGLVEAPK
jgi:hypothetical protein